MTHRPMVLAMLLLIFAGVLLLKGMGAASAARGKTLKWPHKTSRVVTSAPTTEARCAVSPMARMVGP